MSPFPRRFRHRAARRCSQALSLVPRARALIFAIGGSLVAALGLAALLGFLAGLESTYGWGDSAGMSLFASLGLILLGGAILLLASRLIRRSGTGKRPHMPLILLFLGGATVTLVLWQALITQENRQIRRLSAATLNSVTTEIRSEMNSRISSLTRMAFRWAFFGRPRREEWEHLAVQYVNDFAGYRTILWSDSSGKVLWKVPPAAEPGFPPLPIREKSWRSVLENAAYTGIAQASGLQELPGGAPGFFVAVPIATEEAFEGHIVGVFAYDTLFATMLQGFLNLGYGVAAHEQGVLLYGSAPEEISPERFGAAGEMSLYGARWQLSVWPQSKVLASVRSSLPTLVLVIGLLLAALLTSTMYLGLAARRRLEQTEAAILALKQEVGRRRQAESDLVGKKEELEERSRQLELANKELEAFSYSVSHDLRAPLRGVDGFSQALLNSYHDQLDDRGRDHLRRIRAASQRMGKLIDALLGLSRLTRAELHEERVDLSGLALSILGELREAEPERVVNFHVQDGLRARGDPRLLEEILRNLLENAWKFSRERPVAEIKVGKTRKDGKEAFYVRDNGAGFDMANAHKLFRAFQRLHHASEFPGTGIGLATVQRIIHKHGGHIWAKGEVGKGAIFWFILPATGKEATDGMDAKGTRKVSARTAGAPVPSEAGGRSVGA